MSGSMPSVSAASRRSSRDFVRASRLSVAILYACSAACSTFLAIRLHMIVPLLLWLSEDHGGEYGAGGEESHDARGRGRPRQGPLRRAGSRPFISRLIDGF